MDQTIMNKVCKEEEDNLVRTIKRLIQESYQELMEPLIQFGDKE